MPTQKDFVTASFEEALSTVRGGPMASAFLAIPTPAELNAVYSRGYRGIRPESIPVDRKRRMKETFAAMPRLYEIFPWAQGAGKGKLNCPYTAIKHFYKDWGGQDAQERGDCTVHGTYNAAAMDYAIDCLFGETKWMGPLACENIYRSRGFNSDGWSCEAPCTYVGPDGKGGLLYRLVYKSPDGSETVDLSKYNSSWEGNGRAGNPAWLEELSRKNKVRYVIPINNAEEYRDAIAIGFGINVCSGQGFSSETDENGVAAARGSWSHAMAHTACDDREWARNKYTDMIGGIQQSWGDWNTINGKPPDSPDMPIGMFYSRFKTIFNMISGEDSYAMCSVWGWERTNWEAFDVGGAKDKVNTIRQHFKDSTVEQYYHTRYEKLIEYTKQVTAEGFLVA